MSRDARAKTIRERVAIGLGIEITCVVDRLIAEGLHGRWHGLAKLVVGVCPTIIAHERAIVQRALDHVAIVGFVDEIRQLRPTVIREMSWMGSCLQLDVDPNRVCLLVGTSLSEYLEVCRRDGEDTELLTSWNGNDIGPEGSTTRQPSH